MGRVDNLGRWAYAGLIYRIVQWIESRHQTGNGYPTYREIARRYRLNLDEVDMICQDSTAYGPQIMPHAIAPGMARGDTTVEIVV